MPPADRILILQIPRSAASDAVLSLPMEAAAQGKAVPTAGPVAAGPWPPAFCAPALLCSPMGLGGKSFSPSPLWGAAGGGLWRGADPPEPSPALPGGSRASCGAERCCYPDGS